jgi:hypothetical protein
MSSAFEAYVVLALLFLAATGFGCASGSERNLSVNSSSGSLLLNGVKGASESLLLVSLSVASRKLSPLDRGLTIIEANCDREVGGRLYNGIVLGSTGIGLSGWLVSQFGIFLW